MSRLHGSLHWVYERLLSIVLVPSIGYAAVAGGNPINDMFLGVCVPLHMHTGMNQIITDYLPARRSFAANKISTIALGAGTAASIYACWRLNTRDIGVTDTVKKLLT